MKRVGSFFRKLVNSDSKTLLTAFVIALVIGITGIVMHAQQAKSLSEITAIVSVGMIVAGAFIILGGLLGFIFGIPRTLQNEHYRTDSLLDRDSNLASDSYKDNTNLEQISDWLTKIIVGVGLTQFTSIPGFLKKVATYLEPGLGHYSTSSVLALTMVIYFSGLGFLYGYLLTRLYLPGLLQTTKKLAQKIKAIDEKVEEQIEDSAELKTDFAYMQDVTYRQGNIEDSSLSPESESSQTQKDIDNQALEIVYQQLQIHEKQGEISEEDLIEKIGLASSLTKAQIFYKARKVRKKNRERNPDLMETVIPIFRALIVSDSDENFHRLRGQLGYALKDKTPPDFKEAEKNLTKAINMRGSWENHGFTMYELNRAICRIEQDQNYHNRIPSTLQMQKIIISDLCGPRQRRKTLFMSIEQVQQWMSINGIEDTHLLTGVK